MILSRKAQMISPSPTLAIDAKAKKMATEGINVIGFGTGEPDFDTPLHIKEAAVKAINDGFTKYTPASGILQLREAICRKFKTDNGLDYTPAQIVVSNGAKHSLTNVFQAILNPGDEVILPVPYWVSYPEMIKLADGVTVFLDTKEENSFKFSVDELLSKVTPRTKALVLNSPGNPTGMIYSKEELARIAEAAVEKKFFVISDEVYEEFIYGETPHISIASLGDQIKELTIVVNAVSKTYAMTGWRIGYSASSLEIARLMANIQSNATSNPNSIAQKAALAAISDSKDEVYRMRSEFEKRRNYMVDRINSVQGLSCRKPDGAFYVMMNISQLLGKSHNSKEFKNSDQFAEALLETANVALVPGSGFGADNYVRLSYATSMENIVEGLNRIEKFTAEIR